MIREEKANVYLLLFVRCLDGLPISLDAFFLIAYMIMAHYGLPNSYYDAKYSHVINRILHLCSCIVSSPLEAQCSQGALIVYG